MRAKRRELNKTQADLAIAVGKSRWWVIQFEKGERYVSAKEFELEPLMRLKIADSLTLDPTTVLTAADIPLVFHSRTIFLLLILPV
ncbi:hypothetical protein CDES_10990 [Corynebacterium deserti GIMN1.010]|uniref:HTH cro/C1-type domain-containing protein n=1 Tax=Corynebacterium deserti GIMN1.010 TaxID=931089 RepID=A0A0M4CN38_9CORY|nr:hypothetical protein CDES_10990 [Corynebacterium deserti GIMN1.010]